MNRFGNRVFVVSVNGQGKHLIKDDILVLHCFIGETDRQNPCYSADLWEQCVYFSFQKFDMSNFLPSHLRQHARDK